MTSSPITPAIQTYLDLSTPQMLAEFVGPARDRNASRPLDVRRPAAVQRAAAATRDRRRMESRQRDEQNAGVGLQQGVSRDAGQPCAARSGLAHA